MPARGVRKRKRLIAVLPATFVFGACASAARGPTASVGTDRGSALAGLPSTGEGEPVIDVAEGDVDDGGLSAFNDGTLTTATDAFAVQVSASILHAAGLGERGGAVRATLDAKVGQHGQLVYTIGTLQRR